MSKKQLLGADLVVDTLINQDVKFIFGIPGAKIDRVFDILNDRGPKLIITRHEQNAAFMAAAVGRITGKAGVVLVTSGPGASNLVTGIATATAENDPVVAIAANVARTERLKRTHQAMENVALFSSITKFSKEVLDQNNISEAIHNAFREAEFGRNGASFISLPSDILSLPIDKNTKALKLDNRPENGASNCWKIGELAAKMQTAKLPVLLLGMRSSSNENTLALRKLLTKCPIPVVETFQAAGVISHDLEPNFFGRLGLFKNQPGDELLTNADLVITVGYDPIEYYPWIWNQANAEVIHLDEVAAEIDNYYQPIIEIIGSIKTLLMDLTKQLTKLKFNQKTQTLLNTLQTKLTTSNFQIVPNAKRVHPLHLIATLQTIITDDMTVTCDVGSLYIWMARYFRSYEPRRLLFSNGMQTMGVALPWAIAASLIRKNEKVISMSGDGGFLFSAMELETAVRLNLPIVHLVWNDGFFDMVKFQQEMKYHRTAGVNLGQVDYVKYAESFGAVGLRVNHPDELKAVLTKALSYHSPVIVDIPVDYRDNQKLGTLMLTDQIN